MPEPMTVEITITPYGPEAADENPSAYLQRAAESLLERYGYQSILMIAQEGDVTTRQLQVNIPDDSYPGGRRPVTVMAPNFVVDVNGALEILTEMQFNAKYGAS